MVKLVAGNLFKSNAQTLVNTVNCVGVMGKGIALEFKKRFPEMYKDYVERCKNKQVKLGEPYLYKYTPGPWILNFPTKDHWRSVSKLKDIEKGLDYLIKHYKQWGITSLAVPPLGCGQGGLDWNIVGPMLYTYLGKLDIPVELYAPLGASGEKLNTDLLKCESVQSNYLSESIKPGWVALVEILYRIEKQLYYWPVGRTKFQKIAYVATKEGIPTGLIYKKASYGPFSKELKSVITKLVNNGLILEKRCGRMFIVKVGPTFHDLRNKHFKDIERWEATIEKIADLFIRMRTDQAELATTVMFSVDELKQILGEKPSEMDVLEYVLKWKRNRQPPLDKIEVASTIRNLAALNWLEVKPSADLPVAYEF
ncbi:type II toxin-antitoxin system antitoxin DNA ADP-ribosyl glycohydrolase DarG [Thermoanaerobacterium sp. DL9XJH110]|uniref:type II toxin-antitoxin system antitoxin DNA ADP-ribosyl glycohydrolase DarG n=1 Tax=Thermoanaerobacterium sp. DL9XJH110 TaxID=3386643 RepID=UPI003BB656B5